MSDSDKLAMNLNPKPLEGPGMREHVFILKSPPSALMLFVRESGRDFDLSVEEGGPSSSPQTYSLTREQASELVSYLADRLGYVVL